MTNPRRVSLELHERLDDAVGQDAADTLMGYLPPVGWADVATRADLDALRVATKADIEGLRAAFDELRTETRTGFAAVEVRFAQLKGSLHATLHQTALTLFAAIIAAQAVAIGAAFTIVQFW